LRSFPFLQTKALLIVFRIAVGLFLMAHGLMRLYVHSLQGFGEFLASNGFPYGYTLAWCVTLLDIIGGALLVLGIARKPVCIAFIIELLMGIILVHFKNGWFVVGHQSGGMEYSVLLILCLLLIASTGKNNNGKPA
jgi:putative oxidoreductase